MTEQKSNESKTFTRFLVAIVLSLTVLIASASVNVTIGATQVANVVVSSGAIQYNLAAIPSFWSASEYSTLWTINSQDQATRQSIVYPAVKNGQTVIELNPNPTFIQTAAGCGGIYELDGKKTPISPGDQIVYSVLLMHAANTTYENNSQFYTGIWVGIDLWTNSVNGRIGEITTPNGVTTYPSYPVSRSQCNIPWGNTSLTKITISFIVQPQYIADPWGGYTAGTMVTPTCIIPWILGSSANSAAELAKTWIFSTELYINR